MFKKPDPPTPLELSVLACLPKYPLTAPAPDIAEDVGLGDCPEHVGRCIARLRKNGVPIRSEVCIHETKLSTAYGLSIISKQVAEDLLRGTKKLS